MKTLPPLSIRAPGGEILELEDTIEERTRQRREFERQFPMVPLEPMPFTEAQMDAAMASPNVATLTPQEHARLASQVEEPVLPSACMASRAVAC